MSNILDQLLAEASEAAHEDELQESSLTLGGNPDLAILESVEDIIFNEANLTENGEEDFAANFDPAIDSLQFFNNSYTTIDNDELSGMFNPDDTGIFNDAHSEFHGSEADDLSEGMSFSEALDALEEGEDPENLVFKPEFHTTIIDAEEQLFNEDEEVEHDTEDHEEALKEAEKSIFEEETEEVSDEDDDAGSLEESLDTIFSEESDEINFDELEDFGSDEDDDDDFVTTDTTFDDEDSSLEESHFLV